MRLSALPSVFIGYVCSPTTIASQSPVQDSCHPQLIHLEQLGNQTTVRFWDIKGFCGAGSQPAAGLSAPPVLVRSQPRQKTITPIVAFAYPRFLPPESSFSTPRLIRLWIERRS